MYTASINNHNHIYNSTNNNSHSDNSNNSNNYNDHYKNSKSLDSNYNILKREFNNLYNNTILLNESIKNYCINIKDIYLNSNGLLNSIKNNYNTQHPLNEYSESLLNSVIQSFDEWIINQQPTLNSISNYCIQLQDIDLKIQKLDQLELNLLLNNNTQQPQQQQQQQQYILDKDSLFQDVKLCFDNKITLLDIPIINFQFSIQSLFQSLNNIHSSLSNDYLLPYQNNNLPYYNPILNLSPNNNINNNNSNNSNNVDNLNNNSFILQQQQQQQQQQQKPLPFNLKKRPVSINNNINPVLKPLQVNQEIQDNQVNNSVGITKQRSQSVFSESPIIKPKPPSSSIIKPRPVPQIPIQDEQIKPLRPAPLPKELSQQQQQQQQISPPIFKPRPAPLPKELIQQNNQDIQEEQQIKPLRPAPLPKELIQQNNNSLQKPPPQIPIIKSSPLQQQQQLNNKSPTIIKSSPLQQQQPLNNTSALPIIQRSNNNQIPTRLPPKPLITDQSKVNNNNNNKFSKLNQFIISDNKNLHPNIDQHLFDFETHKRMWNRYFKLNKVFKYKIRFTHKREISVEEGQLNKVIYYWYKPQSFQFQEITLSICQLVDNNTGKIIDAVSIPTCLYDCYKIQYDSPPPKSNYTIYHITECNLYSNELEEVNNPKEIQVEPITEKEIEIFTRCEKEISFDSLEFKQFIDQYKLYPLQTKDGTIESRICFAYRISLFIYKHITYDINSGGQTALVTFSKKTANCESFSNLFASILRYHKIPVRYLSGKTVDKDQNHIFGKHAQSEFYCNDIGWVPYNGAARDWSVYNKFAFGRNKGDLFVQESHYVTNMEYNKGNDKFLSIVNPSSTFNYNNSQKFKFSKPIDIYDLNKLIQSS